LHLETKVMQVLGSNSKKLVEKKPTEKPKPKVDVDELKKALRESLSKLSSQEEKQEGEN